MGALTCLFPHCTCATECDFGGPIPNRDPTIPLFDRAKLRELADRHELAVKFDKSAPEFHLSNEDMAAIVFSLRFTASRL